MAFGLKNTAALIERRQKERQSVAVRAFVHRAENDLIPIDIEILSARGFLATAPLEFPKGMVLRVRFPSGRTTHARVVWLEESKVGWEFLTRVEVSDLLVAPPPYRRSDDYTSARKSRLFVAMTDGSVP